MVLFFAFRKITPTFLPPSNPLNILDGALFVVSFLLNTLFLLFRGILTCNCIGCGYLVGVYTVNRPRTPYCLLLTAENIRLTFGVVLRSWKHQPYLCFYFQTSKYVRRYLVCCFSACKYVMFCCFEAFSLLIPLVANILLQFTL